ncbi:pYEATS domain-containing protein [Pannonibacter phragmitetus]|uniref:pYEATS domain-containing protein n=1 Tax=Pannonibacter phragmitetus TaxID=121719 RepID=UPI000AB4BC8E|nr:pYEATS domain-containing protein [Pannonibacter phragmitetus]
MKGLASLIGALAGFAWPALIAFGFYYFRGSIREIARAISDQVRLGASVKYGQLELVGKKIDEFPLVGGDAIYEREAADQEMYDRRNDIYEKSKNLHLVHRFKKTEKFAANGNAYFDISVFIVPHKNRGRLNDVERVEYYFGKHFDRERFPDFGAKYVVRNSTDGFAIRTQAYGPSLCEARIVFHDETSTILYRYLDFEGSGYRYQET